jgi:hypothetical protein
MEEGKDSDEMSSVAGVQTKLTVGAVGDKYEQEADRVAAQVMRMSIPPDHSPQVQRFGEEDNPVQMWSKAQSITPVVQRQVDEHLQMRSMVQRAFQRGGNQASGDLESRLNASKGGGSALAPEVRAFMEPRFGADFTSVRVHTGSEAVQMNRELGAQAFAHGSDVYFGAGKSPGNNELTAHELTHVVQQTGVVPAKTTVGQPRDNYKQEAAQAAEQAISVETSVNPEAIQHFEAEQEADARVARSLQVRDAIGSATIQLSPLSDNLAQVWQSSGKNKGKIFDQLRAAEHKALVGDTDVTKYLNQIFSPNSDDLWLALTIQQHGPEPLWPKEAFDERRRLAKEHHWAEEAGHIEGSLGTTAGKLPVTAYYFPGTSDERALIIGGVHGSEQSGIEVATMLVDSLRTGSRPYYTVIIVPVLFPDNDAAAKKAHPSPGTDSNKGRYTKGNPVDPNRNFPAPGQSLNTARSRGGKKEHVDAKGRPIQPENVMLLGLIERFRPSRIASVHAKRGEDVPGIFADPHTTASKATKSEQQAASKASKRDGDLALEMARLAKRRGANVPGNRLNSSPNSMYPIDNSKEGTSLGSWGPRAISEGGAEDRASMTVITVEVQHYESSSAESTEAGRANRIKELEAHRDALREIFLGPPSP